MRGGDVRIVEVGPRDGLQNVPQFISTPAKIELIEALAGAGLEFIEATSFVNPQVIPQMSDSREVGAALRSIEGVAFSALVPNMRGLESAIEAGIRNVGVLTATTESYNRHNTNTSVAGSLDRIEAIVAAGHPAEVSVRAYVSCAVSCPYEGPVEPERAGDLAARLIDLGCEEVVLADTTGEGNPGSVRRVLEATLPRIVVDRLGVHFHDTYGQALANTAVAIDLGIRMVDASVAGLGGSPSAPGAGGNLATEDLVYLLEGLGFDTGIELPQLAGVGVEFCSRFGIPHASRTGQALVQKAGAPR